MSSKHVKHDSEYPMSVHDDYHTSRYAKIIIIQMHWPHENRVKTEF